MPDAHPLRSGDPTRLGAYEILGRLGEGGQGSVFLGRRAAAAGGTGGGPVRVEYVAIKLLHAGLTGDDAARARFVRELEVAKRVARFCTAQVLDADVEGDQPYIVGEYVPGQSLFRLVQTEGPRTAGALERLAISTLTALIAIHQAGIVHRDFKPHNVMMGPDGPRVIDFGVARALNAVGETQNVGTPAYMSPEHFTGGEVGPASDMFAWGTTMVFAANGWPAFGNDDMAAVMHRILAGEPNLGDLPSPLREVVLACLAKEPTQRPSARGAQEMLVNAATGTSPADGPGPLPGPPPPFPGPFPGVSAPEATPLDAPTPIGPAPIGPAPIGPAPIGPAPVGPAPVGAFAGPEAVHGTTAPQPPGPVPAAPPRRRGRLVPVAAAVAVTAVLVGGSVWAATGRSDDTPDRQRTTAADQNGDVPGGGTLPGGGPQPSRSRGKGDGKDTGNGSEKPKGEESGKPRKKPDGEGSRPSGSPKPPAEQQPNKYTPQQACGGGYGVLRSMPVSGGTAYLLYNNTKGSNCAVTMKTRDAGRRTPVSVWIQKQGGGQVTDSGSFEWYAGPVYVSARKVCVRFGGNGRTSAWGNCG